jgi:hypothetical protein
MRNSQAGEAGRRQELVQSVPIASFGRKTGHRRAKKVCQLLGPLRAASSEVITDHVLGCEVVSTCRLASLAIIAANAFKNEATRRLRIGSIVSRRLFEDRGQALGHRAIIAQQDGEWNSVAGVVALEHARVEACLASKGGVETWRIDPERLGHIRDADRIVAPCMKELLGSGNGLLRIEAAGTTTRARFICNHPYTILDQAARVFM